MSNNIGDITRLKTSWTKYDTVQVIEIIGDNDLKSFLKYEKQIDEPVLKSYLGIKTYDSPLPDYWNKLQQYPKQKRLFTLAAGIFTHHENIKLFAEEFSKDNMTGLFKIGNGGKHMTNLRSALVVSGAAKNSDRRKDEVPYDFSILFFENEIGKFFKELLVERLVRIGYNIDLVVKNFVDICINLKFHKVLSLKEKQFERWIEGKRVYQVEKLLYNLDFFPKEAKTIKVNQWLNAWNDIDFSNELRKKPLPFFLIFKIDIRLLKRLSDVHRRGTTKRRFDEQYVQRGYEEKRSQEITKYIEGGFPWSTIQDSDKKLPQYEKLKMPGILPTTIVANILGPSQKRGNSQILDSDLIKIKDIDSDSPSVVFPDSIFNDDWDPELKPIEIIDGQHRLMAFNEKQIIEGSYEVPIVAYYDLDRTWQAYLFYVINIKPKKINTSLGYDLYPLLRTQEWLENTKDGLTIYRETRAQELVEALWIYEQSPWHFNINMIGANEGANISQAAFIRALTSSYLRRTIKKPIGGLFSDILPNKNFEEIRWVRAQQAAFLILLWENIALSASNSSNEWAVKLRSETNQLILFDAQDKRSSNIEINGSFLSKNSMLSRDQGVTGISMFTNDLFFVIANYFEDYDFNSIEWKGDIDERQIEINSIDEAINQFRNHSLNLLIKDVANTIMNFDWRSPTAEFEDEMKKELQKKYKGSGGYREVWKDLIKISKEFGNSQIEKYVIKIETLSNLM